MREKPNIILFPIIYKYSKFKYKKSKIRYLWNAWRLKFFIKSIFLRNHQTSRIASWGLKTKTDGFMFFSNFLLDFFDFKAKTQLKTFHSLKFYFFKKISTFKSIFVIPIVLYCSFWLLYGSLWYHSILLLNFIAFSHLFHPFGFPWISSILLTNFESIFHHDNASNPLKMYISPLSIKTSGKFGALYHPT